MNRYDLVLLGFIVERESSGYDLITTIKKRELDRWAKISTSTVYNRLARLEKSGSIVGRVDRDGNRPERTLYTITDKGRSALRKEIVRHLTGFNDDPRILGYAFLYGADPIEVARTLEAHVKHLEKEIVNLQRMIDAEPRPTLYEPGPFLNCLSRDHIAVELQYTKAAITILRTPENFEKFKVWFGINFGSREFPAPGEESTGAETTN